VRGLSAGCGRRCDLGWLAGDSSQMPEDREFFGGRCY